MNTFTDQYSEPANPIKKNLEPGTRVMQAHSYKFGTVIDRDGYGHNVIFDDLSKTGSQSLDAISPFCKIKLLDETPKTLAEIEELKEAHFEKLEADRAEQKIEAEKKAQEVEKITAELREKYPWATDKGSVHARAAKNLRRELKEAFAGAKFSVRSSTYSGGNSVDVSYTDGPSYDDVSEIAKKYQGGHFDGMQDIYEYNSSSFSNAVGIVLGTVKYVSVQRSITEELKAQVKTDIQESYANHLEDHDLDRIFYRAMQKTNLHDREYVGLSLKNGDDYLETKEVK